MADLEAVLYDSSGCHLYYDTGDERIASIAQANQYEINVPGKLAQSDLELPDDSQICFQIEVTPEFNDEPQPSQYYTNTIIIPTIWTFYHCDPDLSAGNQYPGDQYYTLGESALEIEYESVETSRCAKTEFKVHQIK